MVERNLREKNSGWTHTLAIWNWDSAPVKDWPGVFDPIQVTHKGVSNVPSRNNEKITLMALTVLAEECKKTKTNSFLLTHILRFQLSLQTLNWWNSALPWGDGTGECANTQSQTVRSWKGFIRSLDRQSQYNFGLLKRKACVPPWVVVCFVRPSASEATCWKSSSVAMALTS